MSQPTYFSDDLTDLPWPTANLYRCEECQLLLADYLRQLLAGQDPAALIPVHLENCVSCSWAYLDLIDLMTATQIKQLLDGWLEPTEAPLRPVLNGLQNVWQVQLGAAERVNDIKAAAWGLSVLGLVERLSGDRQEAREVHQLALRTAETAKALPAKVISYADLGYVAPTTPEALDYFEKALQAAVQLTDEENEARLCVLLGKALEKDQKVLEAQKYYERVLEIAEAWDPRAGLVEAPGRQPALTGMGIEPLAVQIARANLARLKSGMTTPGASVLNQFYRHVLRPIREFASAGEKLLVVNTAKEVPMQMVEEPSVDREGNLSLFIKLDLDTLNGLPEEFFIEVLFLPTLQVLRRIPVGPEERLNIRTINGLELKAKLPGIENLLEQLEHALQQEHAQRWQLPRTAVALLIRWDEDPHDLAASFEDENL